MLCLVFLFFCFCFFVVLSISLFYVVFHFINEFLYQKVELEFNFCLSITGMYTYNTYKRNASTFWNDHQHIKVINPVHRKRKQKRKTSMIIECTKLLRFRDSGFEKVMRRKTIKKRHVS